MNFKEDPHIDIFRMWISNHLTKLKQELIFSNENKDFCETIMKFPEGIDSEYEGEVKITVRKKNEFRTINWNNI